MKQFKSGDTPAITVDEEITLIGGLNSGAVKALNVDSSGNISVSIDPTGLATSAKQDTGNTSIASIDTKTPALGQALAAASVPVVLTAAQITTLTPPAAITGFATSAKQDTMITSLGLLDNVVNSDGAVSGADGAMTAGFDGTNARLIRTTSQGEVKAQLIAGTAAIGKLAANDGVDIGNVDVASSALPTGAATSALQPQFRSTAVATNATTGVQTTVAAPGSGNSIYIVSINVNNNDAAGQQSVIKFNDTVVFTVNVPTKDNRTINFACPIKVGDNLPVKTDQTDADMFTSIVYFTAVI